MANTKKRVKAPKAPKAPKTTVSVKPYTRSFSAAKLPPRADDGRFRPKRRTAQVSMFK